MGVAPFSGNCLLLLSTPARATRINRDEPGRYAKEAETARGHWPLGRVCFFTAV